MNHSENSIGIPKIPKVAQNITKVKKVGPPKLNSKKVVIGHEYEHTWELIYNFLVQGLRNLPKMIKSFIIPLAIVTVLNIILESIPTYTLYGFKKTIVFFLIFITASYNSIIPRTIFWIVILTIGRKMFRRIKSEGISKTLSDFKQLPINVKKTSEAIGKNYVFMLLGSAGLGFVVANFLSRNNRFDKVAVGIVLAISIVDTLSKGNKTTLFTAIKLIHKDLAGIARKKPTFTDNHVYIAATGFALGLIGNLIFGVIKLDFGGYILGAILAIIGMLMAHTSKKEVKAH